MTNGRTRLEGSDALKTSRAMAEGGRRVTMAEIARSLGVSQATVSLVLSRAPGTRISQVTRDKVIAAAREMGYRRLLPAQESNLVVALIINDLTTSQHLAPLIEGARDEAAANGCLLLVIPTNGSRDCEAAALEFLAGGALLGVIYATLLTQSVTLPDFLRGLPTVLLNCHAAGEPCPTVVPGDVAGGFAATSHLLEAGHRRIGMVNGEDCLEAARDRLKGYRQALATWEAPLDPRLVAPGGSAPHGRKQAARLLDLPDPPTALFCYCDGMALGAYEAAAARGLRVPEDLSIVGFDDAAYTERMSPPLTTVALPHEEMARWAVSELSRPTRSNLGRPRRVRIDCPLVPRGSVSAPPMRRAGSRKTAPSRAAALRGVEP